MEETPEVQEDLGSGGKFKNWLQDNIRIILSVLIVVAIAAGIYSYSKRAEAPIGQEEIAMEEIEQQEMEEAVTIIGEETLDVEEDDEETVETISEPDTEEAVVVDAEKEDVRVGEDVEDSQTSISEETETSFIETAVRGDSVTTLSRKALRNYLEKSNDSSLTAEHKIYIEDYMRKKIDYSGGLQVGEQMTFSKVLIEEAIGQAKTLNDNQLENLKKYSSRVSNL